ncbi:MAG: CTP synthase [Dehalococcoidia bacterium]
MSKFIFVTGGVVSSLGKGIAVASIGKMLKSRNLTVSVMKLDPYLNVDPGTMSPYQHGEVFVTDDGSETDLDLGHYERFIDVELTQYSNITAGQIYSEVISKERSGEYLGGTIQTIPHVTNLIRDKIINLSKKSEADVIIVEVGGTVGDIEGQPFLEAIRQVRNSVGRDDTFYIHLTLLPYLGASNELKTKPTQHSVNTLRSMGIQPDAILCRADFPIGEDERKKISLYCDVDYQAVIDLPTLNSVYQVPLHLENQGLGKILMDYFSCDQITPDFKSWEKITLIQQDNNPEVEIALVGKYVELKDSYLSVIEALNHAAIMHEHKAKISWISAEELESSEISNFLSKAQGIIIPGGFGDRGLEGMIKTAEYARTKKIPYLGLCLGMQIMVIEYARNVLKINDANSLEIDPNTKNPVIAFMPGQEELHSTGGTMRLGSYPCVIKENTVAMKVYKESSINERHRHRYEFNNKFREEFNENGMLISGTSPDNKLVEITEIFDHPFMIGSQFHPEFKSRPERPHPLFSSFIENSKEIKREGDQHDLF